MSIAVVILALAGLLSCLTVYLVATDGRATAEVRVQLTGRRKGNPPTDES